MLFTYFLGSNRSEAFRQSHRKTFSFFVKLQAVGLQKHFKFKYSFHGLLYESETCIDSVEIFIEVNFLNGSLKLRIKKTMI